MIKSLKQFQEVISPADRWMLADVEEFAQWHIGHRAVEFNPAEANEVDLKTYMLHLRINGTSQKDMQDKATSLQRFYEWVHGQGLISKEEFARLQFDPSIMKRSDVRMRHVANSTNQQEIELNRLRTLNHISDLLNKSVGLRSTLSRTLEGLVDVLGLQTGWVSLRKETAKLLGVQTQDQPHDFCLSASCNLPPALEKENFKYLRQPPDCYCQKLLREGRLTHAVNVVECSRIRDAAIDAGDTRNLNYHATIPLATPDKVHGLLNIATEDWELFTGSDLKLLSIVGQQIASTIERGKLYEITRRQQKRMERELTIAQSVQASMMPSQLPNVDGYSLAAEWRSARAVAGDFYDIFMLDDNHWGFVIADVSGKGVPAALYMATVRTLIRECKDCASPGEMLEKLNRKLLSYSSSDMFVTLFCGILEPNSNRLVYANAGHDSPILIRATGEVELLESTGPLLGVFGREPFDFKIITLNPEDTIISFTDGVTDARNDAGDEYGRERLLRTAEACDAGSDASDILQKIIDDMAAFTGSENQVDDITLFLIQKT